MARITYPPEGQDGWTEWFAPAPHGKQTCCDCGLTHDVEYRLGRVLNPDTQHEGMLIQPCEVGAELPAGAYTILTRVRRNARSTGQVRRHKKDVEVVKE